MEPYEEAERREAEWDKLCAAAPRCMICGDSVLCFDNYYEFPGGQCICEGCMSCAEKEASEDFGNE